MFILVFHIMYASQTDIKAQNLLFLQKKTYICLNVIFRERLIGQSWETGIYMYGDNGHIKVTPFSPITGGAESVLYALLR